MTLDYLIWNCKPCGYTIRPVLPYSRSLRNCPHCGQKMIGKVIEGTVNQDVKCDIRCTSAKGHKCNCQCGGKNHASDWTQLGRSMSEVLAA